MSEVQTVEDYVTITIDGKQYKAKEGEYILNAARANGVFIPAICYLTRCSPTLACRICLVEADGKRVYACNAKVKEGMEVVTETPDIMEERRAIMEVYDVNHPLQCGVCDKHGECELQNYTLELQVDSQSYAIPDLDRRSANWSSVLHYDPALCIVCERCVTVCKDMIGDNALGTTKRGGEGIDKQFKESMPKDAYAMWNKLQKSLIAPSNGTDQTDCSDCGECLAVCPVGALVSRDFMYSSNPWDLTRVPAVAPHGSDGFHIYYEVKPRGIEDRSSKIYRVTNEWNFVSLDGSARFAYDFENRGAVKNPKAFKKAVEALQKCETIRFNALISNEEALMLQMLKTRLGKKLYNPEVRAFQKFLEAYRNASGRSLWSTTPEEILRNDDFVVSVGVSLYNDSPSLKYAFNNVQKLNKGAGLYCHTIAHKVVGSMGKTVEQLIYKPGQEELALYLVLDLFADKEKLPESVRDYLAGFKRKESKTVTETVEKKIKEIIRNEETGEEEEVEKKVKEKVEKQVEVEINGLLEALGQESEAFMASFEKMMKKKESFSLMLGEDLYYHPKADNIAKLVALIEQTTPFKTVMVPPKSNALGVALICDLDDEQSGYTVGYNEAGDFRLSALGDGDLDMPAMNQQEGTLTSISKRVLPTNAAVEYEGYELNDLMKALFDDAPDLTVDWTPRLPEEKGFKPIAFDDLPNEFLNDGTDNRGYRLREFVRDVATAEPAPFDESTVLEGEIAYRCNPARQFNDFTDKAHEIFEPFGVYASPEKAESLGEQVEVVFEGGSLTLPVMVDNKIEGEIVKVSDFKALEGVYDLFGERRYCNVTLKKV